MKIQLRSKQLEMNAKVLAHIERRLQFGLGRLSQRIHRVAVHIGDLNGPRGGEDKTCRIEVRLLPTGSVFADAKDVDLDAAVDRAADRVARSVSRAIKRALDRERAIAAPRKALRRSTGFNAGDRTAA
jgi:ribosome-associated translation inhibitor RaiA